MPELGSSSGDAEVIDSHEVFRLREIWWLIPLGTELEGRQRKKHDPECY